MIKAIVAAASDWGIGKKNGLLFNLPLDMSKFRAQTANSIVICGENTLLSFPNAKPLKNRSTIVLCPEGHEYDNCICVHDFGKLVKMAKVLSITNTIYVIGGGMMYKSMLPYYDEVIVNKVKAIDPETTVFFPNMDEEKDFVVSKIDEVQIDNGYETQFYVYERKPVEVPIETSKLKLTTAMHITEDNLDLFEEALRR